MINKSATTDHLSKESHAIGWQGPRIVDKDSDKRKSHVSEVTWMRRTKKLMNRDEGIYELSNDYDDIIQFRHQLHWKSFPGTEAKVYSGNYFLDVL